MAFAVRLMSGVSRAFNHVLSSSGPKLHLPLLQERSIFTSPALMAMPVKKKRKLDPQIVRAREERRKKRITKALKFVFCSFLVLEHPINIRRALLGIKQRSIFSSSLPTRFPPARPFHSSHFCTDRLSWLGLCDQVGSTTEPLNFTNPAHLEIVVRWGQQSKVHITGPISYHKPALSSLMAFSGPWEISGSGETNLFWAQR